MKILKGEFLTVRPDLKISLKDKNTDYKLFLILSPFDTGPNTIYPLNANPLRIVRT